MCFRKLRTGAGCRSDCRSRGSAGGILEGPVSTRDGILYFTDIDNNVVHRMHPGGQIERAYSPSQHANGLTLDLDGSLLICEQSGQRLWTVRETLL